MKNGLRIAWIAIILALVLSPAVFAEGQKEVGPVQTVQFIMWGGATEKQVVEGYMAGMAEKNPDIKVDILLPADYWAKVQTMIAGRTPPDICYMGFPEFVDFHGQEAILNIQKYADKSKIFHEDDFYPGHLASFSDRRTGDLYGIPKDYSTYAVYYNDDMFRDAGLATPLELYNKGEWTVDKFLESAKRLTTPSVHGLLFDQGRWKAFVSYFAPNWIASVNSVKVNTPEFIAAINFIRDQSLKLKISPTKDQLGDISPTDRFIQQKGAMKIIGRWKTMSFIKADLPFKWNVVPMPKGADGKAHTWVDMVSYSILDGARNPDAAWRVIEYLTGPEGQKAVAQAGHAVPSRLSVANSDAFLRAVRPGFNNEAHLALKDAKPALVFNNWGKIWGVINTKLGLVWTDRKTAEAACAEAQEEIDVLIRE